MSEAMVVYMILDKEKLLYFVELKLHCISCGAYHSIKILYGFAT